MVEENPERNDKALAEDLATRLDAGMLTPTEDDSPELKALLATYNRLQEVLPEPDPSLDKQAQQAILQEGEAEAQEAPKAGQGDRKSSPWSRRRHSVCPWASRCPPKPNGRRRPAAAASWA